MTSITTMVTCRNHGKYLWDAVQSCLNQTLKPKQLIMVDDASVDNSCEVMSKIQRETDVDTMILRFPKGIGHIRAYNKMLELATGGFVHLMAADDLLLSDKFYENAIDLFSPKVGFVTGELRHMDTNGELLDARSHVPFDSVMCRPEVALKAMLKLGNFVCGGCTVVRRGIHPPYSEAMPYTADWNVWIEMLCDGAWMGVVKNGVTPVYGYRQHSAQMSSHTRGTGRERNDCVDAIREGIGRVEIDVQKYPFEAFATPVPRIGLVE